MNRYYIKLAIRNFAKHKLFFSISIVGLAIGIAATVLLSMYTHYEKSYDKFHPQTDNLYRIHYSVANQGKQIINTCRTQTALSWILQDESELIQVSTRVMYEECYMYTDKVKLTGQQVLWADSSFLTVFEPEMSLGDLSSALANKYAVVISDNISHKYFGNSNPIGKIIKLNEGIPFTVTGVFKSIPKNTHLHYDFVVSFTTLEDYGVNRKGNWRGNYVSTYFRKIPSASEAEINRLLGTISEKYLAAKLKAGDEVRFSIMPIKDIYLQSKLEGEFQQQGNETKVNLLMIIALFIMVIAWANSINIITSLSFERARESGILKLNGANNLSLIGVYFSEAFLINFISILVSIVLVIIAFPFFSSVVNNSISLSVLSQPWLWEMYLYFLIGGIITTGSISALIQSSVKPLQVLSNMMTSSFKFNSIRKGLAIFQFSLAIVLIISTLLISKQISFLETQDLGMKADQVLVMRAPSTNNTTGERRYIEFCAFREELMQSPYIKNVTATMNIPGQANRYKNVIVSKNGETIDASFNISYADNNYFETYQVPLIAGRNFYDNIANETRSVIINQQALHSLGFETETAAIGEKIKIGKRSMEIVGIVQNFHHESLQKKLEPYIYQFKHPHEFGFYPALISTANTPELMTTVEQVWKKHYPDAQADFFFLNAFFNKQYQSYRQLSKLVGISSFLAILIACMGLFAFATHTVNKKIKEIGIRKVNGAKITEVMVLLNRGFIKWVAIAFIIATPVAYYAMNLWLENFAYKTELSWWIFALAGVLALGIALLTVSVQSWKAATRNPVEALRYE